MQAHTLVLPINPSGSAPKRKPPRLYFVHVRGFAKRRSVYGFAQAVSAFDQNIKASGVTGLMRALLGD